jgi:branched-chain amino acid transport system ATP-binding protein
VSALLRLDSVGKRFGGVTALADVSFDVAPGEILGLMGANGAGKTTLFSLIGGTTRPSAGAIWFDGTRIDGLRPHRVARLGIGRTFQIVRPFGALSVLDNLVVAALHGHARAASHAAARAQALALLDEVGLADRAGRPAATLTLAGRKRLEMARALATGPRLLLLDEVLAGLTPNEVAEALALIRALHGRHRLTLIVIEHVMRALMRLCGRIVVLHHGVKIAEGAPQQIAEDKRVAEAYFGTAEA